MLDRFLRSASHRLGLTLAVFAFLGEQRDKGGDLLSDLMDPSFACNIQEILGESMGNSGPLALWLFVT